MPITLHITQHLTFPREIKKQKPPFFSAPMFAQRRQAAATAEIFSPDSHPTRLVFFCVVKPPRTVKHSSFDWKHPFNKHSGADPDLS